MSPLPCSEQAPVLAAVAARWGDQSSVLICTLSALFSMLDGGAVALWEQTKLTQV